MKITRIGYPERTGRLSINWKENIWYSEYAVILIWFSLLVEAGLSANWSDDE